MAEGPGEMGEHFYCGGLEREGFCVSVIIKRETLNSLNLPTQEEVFPRHIALGLIIL